MLWILAVPVASTPIWRSCGSRRRRIQCHKTPRPAAIAHCGPKPSALRAVAQSVIAELTMLGSAVWSTQNVLTPLVSGHCVFSSQSMATDAQNPSAPHTCPLKGLLFRIPLGEQSRSIAHAREQAPSLHLKSVLPFRTAQ